jgi:hypothetical protein
VLVPVAETVTLLASTESYLRACQVPCEISCAYAHLQNRESIWKKIPLRDIALLTRTAEDQQYPFCFAISMYPALHCSPVLVAELCLYLRLLQPVAAMLSGRQQARRGHTRGVREGGNGTVDALHRHAARIQEPRRH